MVFRFCGGDWRWVASVLCLERLSGAIAFAVAFLSKVFSDLVLGFRVVCWVFRVTH